MDIIGYSHLDRAESSYDSKNYFSKLSSEEKSSIF